MSTRTSHKKSRYGCIQCKKLRVKCDEGKPSCEYCIRNKRECEYLPVQPIRRRKRKDIEKDGNDASSSIASFSSSSIGSFRDTINNLHNNISTSTSTSTSTSNFSSTISSTISSTSTSNLPSTISSTISSTIPSTSTSNLPSTISSTIPSTIPSTASTTSTESIQPLVNTPFDSSIPILTYDLDDFDFEYYDEDDYYLDEDENTPYNYDPSPISPLTTSITPFSNLTPYQINQLEFFYTRGITVFALGVDYLSNIWKDYGIQVALQSPALMNGILAYAGLLMKLLDIRSDYEIIARQNYYSSIRSLRTLLADRSRQHPVEMILSSLMINACSLIDEGDVPVLSHSGDVDLLSIAQGGKAILETFVPKCPKQFAAEWINMAIDFRKAACDISSNEIPEIYNLEFIDYLDEILQTEFNNKNVLSTMELELYKGCIGGIRNAAITSLLMNSYLPIVSIMSEAPIQFTQACRFQRPFAVIILLFMCVLLRKTTFQYRKPNCVWDKCISDSYEKLPKSYRFIGDAALQMLRGTRFKEDINKLNNIALS